MTGSAPVWKVLPLGLLAIAVTACAGHDNDRATAQSNTAPATQNVAQVAVIEVPPQRLVSAPSNGAGKGEDRATVD